MGHHSSYHSEDPQVANVNRLRQYDAAVNSDGRQANFDERMDFQRQKEAFAEAYKTSEAERKASQFEATSNVRGEQVKMLQERLQLQQERQQNDAILKEQAQLAKERATISRQKAGIEFYKGISELDPQSHDFRSKYGELMQKVGSNLVDGDGKVPEDVQKAGDHLWSQHNAWASMNMRQQPNGGNATTALQDALAASKPLYGQADPTGKNFNATEAGKSDQTHVQTTYLPPGSKKPVTEVFPRSVFDSAVAASVARQQGAQPAPVASPASSPQPTAPVAAPVTADTAAPSIPDAAISHLQGNPDLAPDFEAKFGKGSAQQYLQRRE